MAIEWLHVLHARRQIHHCVLEESMHTDLKRACVSLQRVVLFSADPATGLISLRHYTISTAPSGVKKSLKALVLGQDVPDMGSLQDVADLITKSGYGSVSQRCQHNITSKQILGWSCGQCAACTGVAAVPLSNCVPC
jgi:hypothetical protein